MAVAQQVSYIAYSEGRPAPTAGSGVMLFKNSDDYATLAFGESCTS